MGKSICFTGHRKIGGAYVSSLVNNRVYPAISAAIARAAARGFGRFISGGALGVDQIAAQAVVDLGLELAIARPFPSQSCKWPQQSRAVLDRLCAAAASVIDVSPDPYSPRKMQVRNQWMVDQADVVIAVFDGQPGGTANCVTYAREQRKRVLVIDPASLLERWI